MTPTPPKTPDSRMPKLYMGYDRATADDITTAHIWLHNNGVSHLIASEAGERAVLLIEAWNTRTEASPTNEPEPFVPSETVDKPWWICIGGGDQDAQLSASYTPNNGIRVDVCTDTTDGWETYFFYDPAEAEKLADRLKIWAGMKRRGEYYSHKDDDILAIVAKECSSHQCQPVQPSNTPPLGDLLTAMYHVIAIAKAYKADESHGGNYKGANDSNRRVIEHAEKLLQTARLYRDLQAKGGK